MFIWIDDATAIGRRGVEQTFGRRKHLVIQDGPDKLPVPGATQQGVKINVADPPDDERVRLLTKSGPTKKGNVEETGDVMGPEI